MSTEALAAEAAAGGFSLIDLGILALEAAALYGVMLGAVAYTVLLERRVAA